jgi:hypothetical protein
MAQSLLSLVKSAAVAKAVRPAIKPVAMDQMSLVRKLLFEFRVIEEDILLSIVAHFSISGKASLLFRQFFQQEFSFLRQHRHW